MRRIALLTLPLLFTAVPAAAQQDMDQPTSRTTTLLNDPAQQARLADTVATMMAALMKVNVGPIADIIAKADPQSDARDLPSDATLGEVMGRDEQDAQRLGQHMQNSAQLVGTAASTLEAYLPILKNIARDMAAQVEQNVKQSPK